MNFSFIDLLSSEKAISYFKEMAFQRKSFISDKNTEQEKELCANLISNLPIVISRFINSAPKNIDVFKSSIGDVKINAIDTNSSVKTLKYYSSKGYSIRLNQINKLDSLINEICISLESLFLCPILANLYWHPKEAESLAGFHTDDHDTFILQIKGERIWEIDLESNDSPIKPQTLLPHDKMDFSSGLPSISEGNDKIFHSRSIKFKKKKTVHLKAGQLIYLPSGCVHEAKSINKESIHITFGIHHYKSFEILKLAIQNLTSRNKILRRPTIITDYSDEIQKEKFKENLKGILSVLTSEMSNSTFQDNLFYEVFQRFSLQRENILLESMETEEYDETNIEYVLSIPKNSFVITKSKNKLRLTYPGGWCDFPIKYLASLNILIQKNVIGNDLEKYKITDIELKTLIKKLISLKLIKAYNNPSRSGFAIRNQFIRDL
ncbi:MAG TPA: cupin domain-containing protein [Bacteroidales bacterium]|nr:cupin domain-containing protein [Bacteroidales bacterium]